MKAKLQKGFTLIELMIVVAIISILALVALPAYQNYVLKSKLTEATAMLDADKTAVAVAYQANNNQFPLTANPPFSTTVPLNAKIVSAITYTSTSAGPATIVLTLGGTPATATGNGAIDGKFMGFSGAGQTDGTVIWTCQTFTSTAGAGSGQTAMYPYLPSQCNN